MSEWKGDLGRAASLKVFLAGAEGLSAPFLVRKSWLIWHLVSRDWPTGGLPGGSVLGSPRTWWGALRRLPGGDSIALAS